MAAGNTYTQIATQTLSSAGTITFSSIPATYTDLVFVLDSGIGGDFWFRFNSDTGSNYSSTFLIGDGTNAVSYGFASTSIACTYASNPSGRLVTCSIPNYANSSTYRTIILSSGLGSNAVELASGQWRNNSSAINRIDFGGVSNYPIGTIVSLYGITAA